MIYAVLRWIGNIAIHWFYSDVRLINGDRVPRSGPLLVAVNHQNALVDAIMAGWAVPRHLTITAKSTLVNNVCGVALFKAVGAVPLTRTSDHEDRTRPAAAQTRNMDAFRRIIDRLEEGGAVLIFPEGKSHNEPTVAPLKSGLARIALRARERGVRGIHIVPIGLTFEDKGRPGSVAVAQVGEVIAVDEWRGKGASELTRDVETRLRAVSLTANIIAPLTGTHPPPLVRVAAWWGRLNHRIPIQLARALAEARSQDEGEPAMLTMTYGLAFTLIAYAVQTALVWRLLGGWVAVAYLVSLPVGAYWSAYADHY